MKKKHLLKMELALILFGALIASCSQPDSPTPLVTSQTTHLVTQTLATPSKLPSSATPGIDLQIQEKCIAVSSVSDDLPDGVLVVESGGFHETWLLDLKSGQKTELSVVFPILAVSSDFKQLAYTEEDSHQLIIVGSDAKRRKTISLPNLWRGVIQWAGSDSLLIEKFMDRLYYPPAATILYNLKTGEQTEYPPDYPDYYPLVPPGHWGNSSYTNTAFDSGFTQVAYRAGDENGLPGLVLWDIQNQRKIVQFVHGLDMGGAPTWLRDGSAFISGLYPKVTDWNGKVYDNVHDGLPYKNGFDLFQISRNGEIKRLTYLSTKYNAGEESFSLSPNEQKIAFWLNLNYDLRDEKIDRKLAILDIATGKITNLCFSGKGNSSSPIWSPDGKYLIVTFYASTDAQLPDKHLSEVYLIDIGKGIAVKIADDEAALAWMLPVTP